MIRGVLIPFEGDYDIPDLQELEKRVMDKIGYAAQVVEMDNETYDALCVTSDGGQNE